MLTLNHLTFIYILNCLIYSYLNFSDKNSNDKQQFTATDLQKMNKMGSQAVSPDGKYLVYSISNWHEKDGKINSYLEYKNLENNQTNYLTDPNLNFADNTPLFSSNYPKSIAFLSNRGGSNQVWLLPFPPSPQSEINNLINNFEEPIMLTDFEVDLSNVRFQANTITFTAEVFSICNDLKCTADKNKEIKNRGSNTWHVYNKLMVRHWGEYFEEGKSSHLFFFRVGPSDNPENFHPQKKSNPIEILKGKGYESPVTPFGDVGQYDLTNDGLKIAFTANLKDRNEAWSTAWKIYYGDLENVSEIKMLTENFKGRTQDPRFSPNGEILSFLYMNRENSESDSLHINLFDLKNNKFHNLTQNFDRGVMSHDWVNNNFILFSAAEDGTEKLFSVSVSLENEGVVKTQIENQPDISTSSPFFVKNLPEENISKVFFVRNSFTLPHDIWSANFNSETSNIENLNQITYVNSKTLENFNIVNPEIFHFEGGYGDQVQGWVFKPSNYVEGQSYPLAFLIHGGPEAPFLQAWSYRWNPQLWANRGYSVLMINPHGSPGSGQKFTDAVINDWGGVPYQDLMQGLNYASEKYSYINKDNACALGASYGGYMVNWIQGQTDRFKCLFTHDGVFSTLSMFYATEELWFPMAEYCPLYATGCKPWEPENRINFEKFSPEKYIANWKTPHFVVHSSKDYRIPISEGLSLFSALQLRNIPSKFLRFTEENHWVLKPENSIKWYEEVLNWLDMWTTKK